MRIALMWTLFVTLLRCGGGPECAAGTFRCIDRDVCAPGDPPRCGVVQACQPTSDFDEPPHWETVNDCASYEAVWGAMTCVGTEAGMRCWHPITTGR